MFDVGLVAVLIISGVLAFVRGFIQEVLSIGAWIGAIVATIFALPHVKPIAREFIPHALLADVVAGGAVFLVTLVFLSIFTNMLSSRVKGSALNALDRSLGFVFGLLRGAVLVCLLFIGVQWLVKPDQQPDWLRNARSLPLVVWGADQLRALVPSNAQDAAAGAAGAAGDEARKVLETHRMLRDIMSPEPKGPPSETERGVDGYTPKERRDMERLIESGR
jgi:membrane protein required for colicin V production